MDRIERRLWHGDEFIPLTPKEFEVLHYLAERVGKVVKKTELLDAIWADTYIEETTLARNVSWIRKKLKKFSKSEMVIETVPKLGYRFIAEVTQANKDENIFIVEEQTTQFVEIEETITLEPSDILQENTSTVLLPQENLKRKSFLENPKFLWSLVSLVSIFGFGYFIYQNTNSKSKVSFIQNSVRLSIENGAGGSPSFSPDGKKVVYTWNGKIGQIANIFVSSIEKDESIRLTNSRYYEYYPTFSRDGEQIAFLRQTTSDNGEIHLVSVNGGETRFIRTVFSARFSMSFSPDDQSLAHVDTPTSVIGEDFGIYITNIESRVRRRLVETPNQFAGETTPRYSPGGELVAFVGEYREVKKESDVFVVSANGGKPRQITTEGVRIHSLAWSGDGQTIYYVVADRKGGPSQLKRISLSGGEPEFVYLGDSEIANIAISKDGKKIAVEHFNSKRLIWRLMKNGQPPTKLIYSDINNHTPQFLPGSKRFLFVSDVAEKSRVFLANIDGEVIKPVLPESVTNIHELRVSNGGSNILFLANFNGTSGIFTATIEGEDIRLISDETRYLSKHPFSSTNPVWSSDDNWIYFTSKRTGQYELWKIKADGSGETKQITKNGGLWAIPASDNKTIYFNKPKSSDNEIWQTSTEGGEEKVVSGFEEAGFEHNTSWTRTNDGIYFFAQKEDSFQLRFFDFDKKTFSDAEGDFRIPGNMVIGSFVTNGEDFIASGNERATSYIVLADLPK